VSHFTKKLRPM
jgi:hypothetical protein